MQSFLGLPAASANPSRRECELKPKGLPTTLLAGASGRLPVAEKAQVFVEDMAVLAQHI
jgi:hypothetical protein